MFIHRHLCLFIDTLYIVDIIIASVILSPVEYSR